MWRGILPAVALWTALAAAQDVTIVAVSNSLQPHDATDAVLVSTGGTATAIPRFSESVAKALDQYVKAAGFRVINLAAADLDDAAAPWRRQLEQSGAVFTGGGREPALVETKGLRLAFVGADSRDQLTGQVAKLPPGAVAVLLTQTDPVQVADWMRAEPRVVLALVGGHTPFSPDPLRVGEGQYLVMVPGRSPQAAWTTLTVKDGRITNIASALRLPSARPSAAVEAFLQQHAGSDPRQRLLAAVKEDAPPAPSGAGVTRAAENDAVSLRVHGVAVRDGYGSYQGRVAVVDLAWENQIPPQMVQGEALDTIYQVPRLADHLYLVVDGREVARLVADEELPGALSGGVLSLPRSGSRARGNAVFALAAAEPRMLQLRFYDYTHGHISLPVLGDSDSIQTAEPDPVVPLQQNAVVEAGVFHFSKAVEIAGHTAPPGMTFVRVDLRARSLQTVEADASAWKSTATAGERMQIGTVADWTESRKYLHLIVDGQYSFDALPESRLPEAPRFLPDLMTGGELLFLVPQQTASLELRCDFPNTDAQEQSARRPEAVSFTLEGERPDLPAPAAGVTVEDEIFEVAILQQKASDQFTSEQAATDERFLAIDVVVKNTGDGGEFFQTRSQLHYALEDGSQIELDDVSYKGMYPPADELWIPAGQQRAFQVVFRIPAGESHQRLAYAGVTKAVVLDLPPLAAETAARSPTEEASAAAVTSAAPHQTAQHAPAPRPAPGESAAAQPEPAVAQAEPPARPAPAHQPSPPSAHGKPQPRGLAGVGLTAEEVNQAIDRGAAFIWKRMQDLKAQDNSTEAIGEYNINLLATLALVNAGAHHRFPEFNAELRAYLDARNPRNLGTYEAGVFCMLIEAYGDATYLPKLRDAARYLLEGQGPGGAWSYGVDVADSVFASAGGTRALQVSGGRPLEDGGAAGEPWKRLTEWNKDVDGDNSVSQYALLGLHSASRAGIKAPQDAWQRALAMTRKRQGEDGGWSYFTERSYGAMTCAGLCAVALCRYELGEKAAANDPAIDRGLAWLVNNFSVAEHPESHEWYYYYMYSLERTGRILDTEFFGPHEWYPLGARALIDRQQPDGSWVGEGSESEPRLATGFSLLFLTRATPTLATVLKRGGEGILTTGSSAGPGLRLYIILDASGSMLAEIENRRKFDIARDAVAQIVRELPAGTEVGLRVYGHRTSALDPEANQDTALEIPLAALDQAQFLATLQSLRCRGKTPLALSLLEARQDLEGQGLKPITVVLLTDGGEDTLPRQDPIKAAAEFAKLPGVKLHIIGFDINREDWSRQLRSMADAAGAAYWPADRSEVLNSQIRASVLSLAEQYQVLDKDNRAIITGRFGDSHRLPEGLYTLTTTFGGHRFSEEFWINTDTTTAITFDAANATPDKGQPVAAVPQPLATPVGPAGDGTETTSPAAPAAQRFCTQCGRQLTADTRFCTGCGNRVSN